MRILLIYPAPPRSRWPLGQFRSRWVPTGLACISAVLRRAGHTVAVHLREQVLERHHFDWAAADAELREALVEAPKAIWMRSFALMMKRVCSPSVSAPWGGSFEGLMTATSKEGRGPVA